MEKRGARPKGKVKIRWSRNFAYAIGLLVSDGNVSSNGRHVSFASKDLEQIENFQKSLGIDVFIGKTLNGNKKGETYRVQFGDVLFIDFLHSIGIKKAKSKTIGKVLIPERYFFDFLRGVFDGDGYSYSYFDARWPASFMCYVCFCSASDAFIRWIQEELLRRLNIKGHITMSQSNSCLQLKYAKTEAVKIIPFFYRNKETIFLSRKKLKIKKMLGILLGLKKGKKIR